MSITRGCEQFIDESFYFKELMCYSVIELQIPDQSSITNTP